MKLSVDTKEDSHDDIRKVIKMLQHFVGEGSYSNQRNIFSDDSPSDDFGSDDSSDEGTSAFSAMFGDDSNIASPEEESSDLEEEKSFKERQETEIMPY